MTAKTPISGPQRHVFPRRYRRPINRSETVQNSVDPLSKGKNICRCWRDCSALRISAFASKRRNSECALGIDSLVIIYYPQLSCRLRNSSWTANSIARDWKRKGRSEHQGKKDLQPCGRRGERGTLKIGSNKLSTIFGGLNTLKRLEIRTPGGPFVRGVAGDRHEGLRPVIRAAKREAAEHVHASERERKRGLSLLFLPQRARVLARTRDLSTPHS